MIILLWFTKKIENKNNKHETNCVIKLYINLHFTKTLYLSFHYCPLIHVEYLDLKPFLQKHHMMLLWLHMFLWLRFLTLFTFEFGAIVPVAYSTRKQVMQISSNFLWFYINYTFFLQNLPDFWAWSYCLDQSHSGMINGLIMTFYPWRRHKWTRNGKKLMLIMVKFTFTRFF